MKTANSLHALRRMNRRRHVLTTAALALAMLGATATASATASASGAQTVKSAGGNSMSAKACQKGGWQILLTSTKTPFVSESECVSYAARGGVLQLRPMYFGFELDRPTCVTHSDGRTTCENTTLVGYGLIPGEKWTVCVPQPGAEPDCQLTGYVAADGTVNHYIGQIVCVPGTEYTATVRWALAGIGCT